VSETTEYADSSEKSPPGAQILGVVILEFGILFHSVGVHALFSDSG
jgi:hypothetical protein